MEAATSTFSPAAPLMVISRCSRSTRKASTPALDAVRTHQRILGRRRAASGCRSAATSRAWTASCANSASSISFWIRTACSTPTRDRSTACIVRSAHRRSGGVRAATTNRASKYGRGRRLSGRSHLREFYRDAGFDVHDPHIAKLRHAGISTFTGLKYHRITGKTAGKNRTTPVGRASARRNMRVISCSTARCRSVGWRRSSIVHRSSSRLMTPSFSVIVVRGSAVD